MKDFFNILFNSGEKICISSSTLETAVVNIPNDVNHLNYFVINPLQDRRLDDNVTSYRNILLESDKITIDEQMELFKEVPFATQVYSGGKSIHTIVSLIDPPETRQEYDALVNALYIKFPDVDKKVKNPSRFSRTAGAFRGAVEQKLIALGNRVTQKHLIDKLGLKVNEPSYKKPLDLGLKELRLLSPFTKMFLDFGAEDGEWNNDLFIASCELCRYGYNEEDIKEKVYNINGLLTKDDIRTIKSAINNEQRKQNEN